MHQKHTLHCPIDDFRLNKKNSLFIIYFVTLLLHVCPSFGMAATTAVQSLSFAPVNSLSSKMPDNISGLVQDSKGFLWIATLNGLYRYDGRNFKSFRHDPRDNSSLADNLITSIRLLPDGNLLLATVHGGILFFNPRSEIFTLIKSSDFDFSQIKVQTLFVEGDNYWIGAFQGLFKLDKQNGLITRYIHNPLDEFALPGRLVNSIVRDKAEQLWVGTDSGLAILNTNTDEFTQFHLPGNNKQLAQISKIYLDTDGSIWIGTEQRGLFHITGAGSRVDKIDFGSGKLWVRDIIRLVSGELWVASEDGIYVLPAFGNPFKHYVGTPGDPLSLPDNDVWTLLEDASSLVIIGTTKGLYKTAPNLANFKRLLHAPLNSNSLSHDFVTDLAIRKSGDILISTLGGLDLFSPTQNKIRHIALPLANSSFSNRLQSIYIDTELRTWLGDNNGQLLILDDKYQLVKTVSIEPEFSQLANRILFIKQTKNGDMWIGTDRALINFDSQSLTIKNIWPMSGSHVLEQAPSVDMVEDAQGYLWFATKGAGLIKFDPKTDQGQRFYHQADRSTSLSQDYLNYLLLDENGALWIATTNGLNRLTKEQSREFTPSFDTWLESDGLLDGDIRGMALDSSGWIWVSTDSGLSRVQLNTTKVENYTEEDGLPKSSFTPGAVIASHQGQLYFGSNHGISMITPENFRRNQFLPRVAVVAVSVRQGPWTPPFLAESTLSYDHNDVQFRIAAFDFHQPYLNRYRYRLIGNNTHWSDNQTSTLISYTNLSSGHYQLEVQGTNNDGYWSKDTARYNFVIQAPWWANELMYIFYSLIVLSIIYWLYLNHRQTLRKERAITEHLRRNDKLKDEFLAVISHELRTPLTGIIGISEAMMQGSSGTLNKRTHQGLGLIANSGKRLASLVNEILDFKKMTHNSLKIQLVNIDIQSAVQVVSATCQPLIETKPIQIRVEVDDNLPLVRADGNRLLQILYNLVGNAIKFTEKGSVLISAKLKQGKVEIAVEDTGVGISKEHLTTIFLPFEQLEVSTTRQNSGSGLGLAITNLLVQLHGSRLQVESVLHLGSRFFFYLEVVIESEKGGEIPAFSDGAFLPIKKIDQPSLFRNQPDVGPVILVADDEPLNRTVICEFLNLSGYRTLEADCGQSALTLAMDEQPDLVILDVMMPRLSGYDVTRKLREHWSAIDLPVLLISAHSEPQDVVAGFEAGANDYISKPINKNVLIARTRTLVMLGDIKRAHQAADEKIALEKACEQLSRYFPKPLVERLLNNEEDDQFEASRRLITTLFADLVGFTELTDRFEAEVITDLLNQFINEMNNLIEAHHGVLNEVMGDGLMVLVGAPEMLDKQTQATEVVKLGVAMQRKMKQLGEKWLNQGLDHNVKMRIGIHQDFATVGNIGAKNLIAYRAIGSGVNLASRLQADCLPGLIRLTYPIYALTCDDFKFEPLEECQYKGFHHPHRVCTLDPEKN